MNHPAILIQNQWQEGTGDRLISEDPVYHHVLWDGLQTSVSQVESIVQAAHGAARQWSLTSLSTRIEIIQKFKAILAREKTAFATLISQETGKPLWEGEEEVSNMINKVTVSITAYHTRTGEQISALAEDTLHIYHKPLGVVAVIGPYNFPGHIPNGHIIPALLAGNAIIFKPSELTPAVATKMAEFWVEAGLPAGVFNVAIAGAEVARALVNHAEINGILFTGSYAAGVAIHRALAGQPHRLAALEMGGNNPLVIGHITQIEAPILLTLLSAYLTSGQRCTCARRLVVIDTPHAQRFIDGLTEIVAKIAVAPFDAEPAPFMSSVISPKVAQQLLDRQAALSQQEGAKLLVPMRLQQADTGLLTPGILDVTAMSNREDAEIFGPFLQLIRVKNLEAAILEANRTEYGLAASLISEDAEQFSLFYQYVKAGVINWNRPTTGASALAPFGGVKNSGNHRPGAFYMADACAYPVASMKRSQLELPLKIPVGLRNLF